MRSTCSPTVADWTSARTLAFAGSGEAPGAIRVTPGATDSPAAFAASVSRAANATAAVMAASCGRGPVVLAGSNRAEFSASGYSGAISPAATSSGLQAGLSGGPLKRESSSNTRIVPVGAVPVPPRAPPAASWRARTVARARVASPARPRTAPGSDSPAPRSTSPPPVRTTDPGVGPATTRVLKRRSGPRTRRAALAVRSFMFDAGTRAWSAARLKSTCPVAASWTIPVKVPPPSVFSVPLSRAASAAPAGTGAVPARGPSPPGPVPGVLSEAGTCCQGGAACGAFEGRSGPRKAGAITTPAGSATATTRRVWSSRATIPRSLPGAGRVPAGLVLGFMMLLVLRPEMSPLVPETSASRYILNSSRRHR